MNSISNEKFSDFLKKIYLSGTITDCVIKAKGKSVMVEAVDPTNSLIVISTSKIFKDKEKFNLGFSNINLLIKFLSTIKEKRINFSITNNKINLSRFDNKRRLNFLLSDPEMISTVLEKEEGEDVSKSMIDMQSYKTAIPKDAIHDYQSYVGLSEVKEATIKLKDGIISITIGRNINHQFLITLEDKIIKVGDKEKSINLIINAELLSAVFSVIDYDSVHPPELYIGKGKPILIIEKETIWAIAPQVEEEGNHEE